MGIELISQEIQDNYEIQEWKHACPILEKDFTSEFKDIIDLFSQFRLCKSRIKIGGGSKSGVAKNIDEFLFGRGWEEKDFSTSVKVDNNIMDYPTHKVDCFKNRGALKNYNCHNNNKGTMKCQKQT